MKYIIICLLLSVSICNSSAQEQKSWRTNIAIGTVPFISGAENRNYGLFDGFHLAADKIYRFNARWHFQAQCAYAFTKFGEPIVYPFFKDKEAGYLHLFNLLAGSRYYLSHEEKKTRFSVIALLGLSTGIDRHRPVNAPAYYHKVPWFNSHLGLNMEIKKHFNLELAGDNYPNFFFKFGYAF
jgi:hypothetical protein